MWFSLYAWSTVSVLAQMLISCKGTNLKIWMENESICSESKIFVAQLAERVKNTILFSLFSTDNKHQKSSPDYAAYTEWTKSSSNPIYVVKTVPLILLLMQAVGLKGNKNVKLWNGFQPLSILTFSIRKETKETEQAAVISLSNIIFIIVRNKLLETTEQLLLRSGFWGLILNVNISIRK